MMELSDKDIKNAHLHMFEQGKHENDEKRKINYISVELLEMKNTISEIKNILNGIDNQNSAAKKIDQ